MLQTRAAVIKLASPSRMIMASYKRPLCCVAQQAIIQAHDETRRSSYKTIIIANWNSTDFSWFPIDRSWFSVDRSWLQLISVGLYGVPNCIYRWTKSSQHSADTCMALYGTRMPTFFLIFYMPWKFRTNQLIFSWFSIEFQLNAQTDVKRAGQWIRPAKKQLDRGPAPSER